MVWGEERTRSPWEPSEVRRRRADHDSGRLRDVNGSTIARREKTSLGLRKCWYKIKMHGKKCKCTVRVGGINTPSFLHYNNFLIIGEAWFKSSEGLWEFPLCIPSFCLVSLWPSGAKIPTSCILYKNWNRTTWRIWSNEEYIREVCVHTRLYMMVYMLGMWPYIEYMNILILLILRYNHSIFKT